MTNTGIILTLAYPDTIVMVADEWYSPFLKYIGIGKKDYLKAGHAALILINKTTGVLEYHDFGRYITPDPMGRVRGKDTDNELDFPIQATITNDKITNINAILEFLGTHPKLTHGDGILVASISKDINYNEARTHITKMQNKHFIRYAAFIKNACNCARFVTDTLIASTTNLRIRKKLIKSKWFTPSTIGNVLLADTENHPYEVSIAGEISKFNGSQRSENLRCFLDKLEDHFPNLIGTITPKPIDGLDKKAQWLSGIAAGAWFELYNTAINNTYRFRRISPYGNIDCDTLFIVDNTNFDYNTDYQFIHYSNCKFFNIKQNGIVFRFERIG